MNFLIVGGGSIGQRHINNLKLLGYKNIYVLKREASQAFEDKFDVKVITSFQQAVTLRLDAVFICSPTALHIDGLRFAKEHKLNIFMEKPLTDTQNGLEMANQISKEFDKVFFIGFMLRYHPLVNKIKAIIESGQIGQVFNARFEFGSYLPYWHPWEDYKTSYASIKELGGGVINTITHELDLIQFFFGTPDSIYCSKRNFGILEIDVEENCDVIFEYINKSVSLHLDYLQKDYDRNIKILGTEGKIIWDWHTNQVVVKKHKEDAYFETLENFDVNQLYLDELKHFIELVESSTSTHLLDVNHALENTRLMLAMHESASVQRVISCK